MNRGGEAAAASVYSMACAVLFAMLLPSLTSTIKGNSLQPLCMQVGRLS